MRDSGETTPATPARGRSDEQTGHATRVATERLLLEPWDETWREEWVALAADPRVTRWIGNGDPWDSDRSEREFDWMLDHWRQHGFGWRSAVDRVSGAWLGFVGLNHVTPDAVELDEKDVEIGWWLNPEVWGQGLATEGALALRDEAFERIGLERLVGRHHAGNPSSGRIMVKIGMTFVRETVGRHDEPVRIYAMKKGDWRARATRISDTMSAPGRGELPSTFQQMGGDS